jgi:cysteine desulfurase family protein (TIGR01976 family)
MLSTYNIATVRRQFAALSISDAGRNRIYFDNPAGTQVPQQVIDRTVEALRDKNANLGGYFVTSMGAGHLVQAAHEAASDFYNAASSEEIVFGQNMTTLTLHFSRCLARRFSAGDEIVLSRMDHEGNVAPWLLMAEDRGLVVKWMDFNTDSYEFPVDALSKVLSSRTKLVAMGMASNCTGTINDVSHFARQAKAAGALVYLDAVQFAPHERLDVQALGADVVVSSAYKWFGPHMAILWAKRELLQETFAYKVRAVGEDLPDKFETGTLSHEGMAGCLGAIEYLEQLGSGDTRRERLTSAWEAIADYERVLTLRLIDGIAPLKGLTIRGVTSANAMHRRVPTVSFTVDGVEPVKLAKHFAHKNIFVWSGHNYALEPIRAMGLADKGGVLRVGLAHYNTAEEVDSFVAVLTQALD